MGSNTSQSWQLFIINPGTLSIENIPSFLKIIKFDPSKKRNFPPGFVLGEDLSNNTGGVLYPKDTELDTARVERLVKLEETNPDYKFKLSVKKSKAVAIFFRDIIKRDFNKALETKKNKQEFRKSIGRLEKTIGMYIDDILKDDELIYILFRARSIDEISSKSGIPRYFNHQINVAIFALEILQNSLLNTGIRFDKGDLINIGILCLIHDIASIENLGHYIDLPIEKVKEYYFQELQQSFITAKMINLEMDIVDSLKRFGDYYQGKKEVLFEDDGKAINYANVLITADIMDLKVSGVFEDPVPIRTATDQLYQMTNNKELKRGFVDALAKGLKLNELFDFYREIERLNKSCLLKKFAKPYPMLGFKSPVLYLCAGKRVDCREYAKDSKAVNLIKANSGLEPGTYGRCKLLSKELVKFYESHYSDIKENVMLRAEENKKKKD
ncbi:MAG: HD domain-containing protein [bacterium]|nr:HD domain-containing protein [bacterium]